MKFAAAIRTWVVGGSSLGALLLTQCSNSDTQAFDPGQSGAGASAVAGAGAGGLLAGAAGSSNAGAPSAGAPSAGASAAGGSPGVGAGGVSGAASAGASNGGGGASNTAAGAAGSGGVAGSAAGAAGSAGMAGAVYNPCPTGGVACRVMPLGDSITWGVGSTDGGGYRDELFKKALAASAKLTFVGSGQSGPQTVNGQTFPRSNEGHSGWTIDDGTAKGDMRDGLYPKVSGWLGATPPNIVLLMIGTNDINIQLDVANAPKRLGLLLDRIIQGSPNALLVVAQIVPTKTDATNARVQTYNAAIPALVSARSAAGKHVVLVDMYGACTANASYKSALMKDDLHPNDAGHAVLAGVWWNAIGTLLPH